ncbi:MAG: Rieske (2Fe-2S) protein [bacterium]
MCSQNAREAGMVLCNLKDLADPDSRGFELETETGQVGIFLVRHGEQVHGYRNSCPHTGAPLEWQPHQFLDITGHFVQCALHGALFTLDKGYCVRGPCAGQSLQAIDVTVASDGEIKLDNIAQLAGEV